MQKRKLGGGLEVSALGLGCMGMSEFYARRHDQESLATIKVLVVEPRAGGWNPGSLS